MTATRTYSIKKMMHVMEIINGNLKKINYR